MAILKDLTGDTNVVSKMNKVTFERFIDKSMWTEAVTAVKTNPHEYVLRRNSIDQEFVEAVKYIRQHGEEEVFWRVRYTMLRNRGRKYWTMGCPLHNCGETGTILINRTMDFEVYDNIAPYYEDMWNDQSAKKEDRRLVYLIAGLPLPVLDVGCGAGLLIDLFELTPSEYFGIDPSGEMLKIFQKNYPYHFSRRCSFETYTPLKKDSFYPRSIVALYGTASYILPKYLNRFVKEYAGLGLFLMFYKPDYMPATHLKSGVFPHWFKHSKNGLRKKFNVEPIEYNNYLIIKR